MRAESPAAVRLRSPRFLAYLIAEFLGVVNDNALRVALQAHLVFGAPAEEGRVPAFLVAGLLFAVPFIVLSGYAGSMADRYPKHRIILILKLVEAGVCGVLLVTLGQGPEMTALGILALMAIQSAFFSPAKYGILPEVLEDRDLSYGNGLVNLTTFVAMAGGGALGLLLAPSLRSPDSTTALPFLALALAGAGAAIFVPRTEAASPSLPFRLNPFAIHARDLRTVRENPSLPMAIVGTAFFYLLASAFQMAVLFDAQERFGFGVTGAAILFGALTLGIGVGSYLAGRWSDEKVELGLVPLGALLLGGSVLLFSVIPPEPLFAGLLLPLIGIGGGFFVIPLVTLIQQKSPRASKGQIIAFSNVMNFSAISVGFLAVAYLEGWTGVPAQGWILGIGLLSLLATLVTLYLLPLFFVRFTVWLFAHTIYRITIKGREFIPRRGPALLIPNHVSWVDAILVQSTMQRFIRFLMFRPFYEFRPTHWFFREAHVIPIAKGDTPERTEASLQQAADELAAGHLVLIFAEGRLTRTGDLSPFRNGYRRILDKLPEEANVPIIPVGLSGLWGSIFSHEGGKFLMKWPQKIPYDVTVRFGRPLPTETGPEALQDEVQRLIEAP